MIRFGLVSSIFDLMTFGLMLWVLHSDEAQFQSGWFIESTLTELAALLVLRTSRRFYRSRPSRALMISSLAVAAAVVYLPFSPLAADLGLTPLAPLTILALFGLTLIYVAFNEFAKKSFEKQVKSSSKKAKR